MLSVVTWAANDLPSPILSDILPLLPGVTVRSNRNRGLSGWLSISCVACPCMKAAVPLPAYANNAIKTMKVARVGRVTSHHCQCLPFCKGVKTSVKSLRPSSGPNRLPHYVQQDRSRSNWSTRRHDEDFFVSSPKACSLPHVLPMAQAARYSGYRVALTTPIREDGDGSKPFYD